MAEGKRERGKEGKRERGKEGKRERGKEGVSPFFFSLSPALVKRCVK
jgi:hypothetical protein